MAATVRSDGARTVAATLSKQTRLELGISREVWCPLRAIIVINIIISWSFEVLPPFVSRRGLSNTNQRLCLGI